MMCGLAGLAQAQLTHLNIGDAIRRSELVQQAIVRRPAHPLRLVAPREIIRSGVVSEVALATAIAICIHLISITLLSTGGFRLSQFILPLAEYGSISPTVFAQRIADRLTPAVLYLGATTALGFGLGWILAVGVVSGPFRGLVHHKWIYDIADVDRKGGIVTAYVMTTIVDEARIIMYKGRLHDIFLGDEGKISYIILKDCARYYMAFRGGRLITSKQFGLFGSQQENRPESVWDRLLIDGSNIANVLFDSSPEIRGQTEGADVLEAAFKEALERAAQRSARAIRP
jgi:hypothetical protein